MTPESAAMPLPGADPAAVLAAQAARFDGTPLLELREVHKTYGSGSAAVLAVRGVSLAVWPGELVALMGPSGSGKTTLLMVLAGLLRPTAGEVWLEGRRLDAMPVRRVAGCRLATMGFVFQGYNLFPALTAEENVALALRLKGLPASGSLALLEQVGLADRRRGYPAELSGGQKQRVAIARALAGQPRVLLADEPTAALDSENGLQVVALLRRLALEQHCAVIMVTHDPRMAALASRHVEMEDGCLRQAG